jgi:hypothetical protein
MAPGGPSDSSSVVAYAAVVPKALLDGLAEGSHPVWVRLLEGPDGSAGAPVPPWSLWDNPAHTSRIDIVVDHTAPAVSAVTISPTPNNGNQGTIGNLGFLDSAAVDATLTDPDLASAPAAPGSGVALGEVFVNETPAADQYGTGQELTPLDGAWDSTTELTRALVPLAVFRGLPDGPVNVYVHGKDRAGNWGPLTPVVITLDRGLPVVTNLVTSTGRVVTFDANDPGAVASPLVAAEWFDAANDPGTGSGTAIPVPVPGNPLTGLSAVTTGTGTVTVGVRVKDAAGNWSLVQTVQVSA